MSMPTEKQFLMEQIAKLEHLIPGIRKEPLMLPGYERRLERYKQELAALNEHQVQAEIKLVFFGGSVKGSMGIPANFMAKALHAFQDLVHAHYHYWHLNPIKPVSTKGTKESQLNVSAFVRGSFGVVLSKQEVCGLFDEKNLATTLAQVTQLVGAAGSPDEEPLNKATEHTGGKTLYALAKLLAVTRKNKAGFSLTSGSYHALLSQEQVKTAASRVSFLDTPVETTEQLEGELTGLISDLQKVHLRHNDGRITPIQVPPIFLELGKREAIRAAEDKQCVVEVRHTHLRYRHGKEVDTFQLLDLPKIL